jgi:hypothetical protein
LRDKFNREYKKGKFFKSGIGAKDVYKSTWELLPNMVFLVKYIKSRATTGNSDAIILEGRDCEQEMDSFNKFESNNYVETGSPVTPENIPRKIPKTESKKENLEKKLLDIIKTEDEDEDRLFCLSLVPSPKRMNARNRSKAKMDILKIIDNYEFDVPIHVQQQCSMQQLFIIPASSHTAPPASNSCTDEHNRVYAVPQSSSSSSITYTDALNCNVLH